MGDQRTGQVDVAFFQSLVAPLPQHNLRLVVSAHIVHLGVQLLQLLIQTRDGSWVGRGRIFTRSIGTGVRIRVYVGIGIGIGGGVVAPPTNDTAAVKGAAQGTAVFVFVFDRSFGFRSFVRSLGWFGWMDGTHARMDCNCNVRAVGEWWRRRVETKRKRRSKVKEREGKGTGNRVVVLGSVFVCLCLCWGLNK